MSQCENKDLKYKNFDLVSINENLKKDNDHQKAKVEKLKIKISSLENNGSDENETYKMINEENKEVITDL